MFLVLIGLVSGCAAGAVVVPSGGVESQSIVMATGGPVRTTSGGAGASRTQKIGLPLSRGAKIGLWSGVAVLLAYLMVDDDRDDGAAPSDP